MQTSPRAELFAIVRALQTIAMVQAYCYQKRIIIYTDSRYCIDSITNWYKKWDRTGWINRRGKPVENKDYIQECRYYIDRLYVNVDLRYVPGHSGVIGNTIADDLACRGAHKPRNMVN
ncbi:hypothetical protein GGI05_002482 [Coemansia sp. RSA 2603]|nr:hypothetical protein GGI05_002482 [Coemansia sp. RSA 2603]